MATEKKQNQKPDAAQNTQKPTSLVRQAPSNSTQFKNRNKRNGRNNQAGRRPVTREERIAEQAMRIERKKEVVISLIDQNPHHTKLVTTELTASQSLASAIDEIETGEREVRMKMGSAELAFEDGQNILKAISWAQSKVAIAVSLLNAHGYGVRNSVYEARQKKLDTKKRISSNGTDPLSEALRERAAIESSFLDAEIATMTKRIEEDKKTNDKYLEQVNALDAQIANLRAEQAAENIAKKEQDASERKKAHEQRMQEAQERKDKARAERIRAHEERVKQQQEEKQKRLAAAAVNQTAGVESSDPAQAVQGKTETAEKSA